MILTALKNLALSDTGFVFDPSTGNTYTLNETALFIVRQLKDEKTKSEILESLLNVYDASPEEVERDFSDVLIQLTELGLIK